MCVCWWLMGRGLGVWHGERRICGVGVWAQCLLWVDFRPALGVWLVGKAMGACGMRAGVGMDEGDRTSVVRGFWAWQVVTREVGQDPFPASRARASWTIDSSRL
jgi:hypothetical protein